MSAVPGTEAGPPAALLGGIDTGKRHVRFLELLERDAWRLKLYGMSLADEEPAQPLVDKARELIGRVLPAPSRSRELYGVGFATVHEGEHGDYLLLDWWHSKDLLTHHLFGAPKGESLRYGWPQNVCCCVYEMAVLFFERNAWYRHVLAGDGANGDRPDFAGYLAERLEGTV